VHFVSFSPDGLLASGGKDQTIRLWNLEQQENPLMAVLHERQGSGISSIDFSYDGSLLTVAWWSGVVKIWNVRELDIVRYTDDYIYTVAFSQNRKHLVSAGKDCFVRRWEIDKPGEGPKVIGKHDKEVRAIVFCPQDSNYLVSTGYDNTLRFWNLSEQNLSEQKAIFEEHTYDDGISALAFHPNGRILVSAGLGRDNHICLWSWEDKNCKPKCIKSFPNNSEGVRTVAFNKEGTLLATGGKDGRVQLWEINEAKPEETDKPYYDSKISSKHKHTGEVRSVSFSPDGIWLASVAQDDKNIYLRRVAQINDEPVNLECSRFGAGAVSFSSRNVLVVGGFDFTIQMWHDFLESKIPIMLHGHCGGVSCIAFSEDGHRLATGGHDNTVRLWLGDLGAAADRVCDLVSDNLSLPDWKRFVGSDIPYQKTCGNLPPGSGAPDDAPVAE
jgi:WD40 repeat protein